MINAEGGKEGSRIKSKTLYGLGGGGGAPSCIITQTEQEKCSWGSRNKMTKGKLVKKIFGERTKKTHRSKKKGKGTEIIRGEDLSQRGKRKETKGKGA